SASRCPHPSHRVVPAAGRVSPSGRPHLVSTALSPRVQTYFYANGENIMAYVDGFVAAVPTANREIYKNFKERGAMKLVECWRDDAPDGNFTSFPKGGRAQERRDGRLLLDHLAFAQMRA